MPTTHHPIQDQASIRAGASEPKFLPAAAERALAEAAARRAERDKEAATRSTEISGRGGPDPTRFGDWEVKGIATDF